MPDIPGKYTVIANFAGTEAYYPSSSETSFVVDPAGTTPNPTAVPIQSTTDQYFIPAVAGIGILIVACFAITILLLRKRP
jgi:hypothetical protein